MEKKTIEQKPKKKNDFSVKDIFLNRDKRFIALVILLVPILCFMVFFGINIYKEAKNLLNMVKDEPIVQDYNTIESMGYVLRDDATEYQEQLFEELRTLANDGTDGLAIAQSVCKNYVADFYTWTNKIAQYDVGGMYYIYKLQRSNVYTKARDEMYKYLNDYIEKYGKENLLEVENVTATGEVASDEYYYPIPTFDVETGLEYGVPTPYPTYLVTCNWTYKENTIFPTSKYDKKMNFVVVNNNGVYQIVEASVGTIEYVDQEQE